jgi:hypothetical protein
MSVSDRRRGDSQAGHVAGVATPTWCAQGWLAEPSAAAAGGPFIGFQSITPSRPPLLSLVVMPSPMRTIPITPGKLTGDVLEACHRQYLDGTDLAAWAEALLTAGFDSDAIIEAVANPDMHWEKVPAVFSRMCREVRLSDKVGDEVAALKQEVMIEEYRHGHRQAAELLHRFDDLRKRIGFPEMIVLRIRGDNNDGSNDSGYYGSESKKRGAELDALVRKYLEKAGIRA